ncbi:MAG TPA: tRNA pseudouridine(38-40) synthase TruA [Methanomassiliicoccales archaeon]|nr:tRNA pseudouridine(38-40) synthase TruA [Methanomassiliicoccales archaeon]
MVWTSAVKIAYNGRDFNGSQRQPDVRTVEGEVLRSLKKVQAIETADSSRFRTASRTDRGVSALGNVVCFDTDFRPDRLLQALNAVAEGVYFHAVAEVPHDFSPRRAKQRWYRYHLDARNVDVERFSACADLFLGRHDFKRFCKHEGRSTLKTIDSVQIVPVGDIVVVDLKAREFLRNMVRRMVAAMEAVGKGEAELGQVEQALQGRDTSFGLADPGGLVLMDIAYEVAFTTSVPETMARRIRKERQDALLNLLFYDSLKDMQ